MWCHWMDSGQVGWSASAAAALLVADWLLHRPVDTHIMYYWLTLTEWDALGVDELVNVNELREWNHQRRMMSDRRRDES